MTPVEWQRLQERLADDEARWETWRREDRLFHGFCCIWFGALPIATNIVYAIYEHYRWSI